MKTESNETCAVSWRANPGPLGGVNYVADGDGFYVSFNPDTGALVIPLFHGDNGGCAVKAYHFVSDTLRDGRPVPADGEWLEHTGPLELCVSGLHASLCPFDALQYAPGTTLCLVELGGEIVHGDDKVVASRRRIIARIDAEPLMREFARWCALQVIELWDAPEVVRRYLETGDESLRTAARDAAQAADAAWAAMAAAWAARTRAWVAWAAAWAAARAAAAWDSSAWGAAWGAQRAQFRKMVDAKFGGAP